MMYNKPLSATRCYENNLCAGGEGGIRTHGGFAPTPDFESGTFDHSATSPARAIVWINCGKADALPWVTGVILAETGQLPAKLEVMMLIPTCEPD